MDSSLRGRIRFDNSGRIDMKAAFGHVYAEKVERSAQERYRHFNCDLAGDMDFERGAGSDVDGSADGQMVGKTRPRREGAGRVV